MTTTQLSECPGQMGSPGQGTYLLQTPGGAAISPGDVCILTIIFAGEWSKAGMGVILPGSNVAWFLGLPSGALFTAEFIADVSCTISATSPLGLIVGVGGQVGQPATISGGNAYRYNYAPSVPAPPVVPGVANLAAQVLNSYTVHGSVPGPGDLINVQYIVESPAGGTYVQNVWLFDCLSPTAAAQLAAALGGTVVNAPPPVHPPATYWQPLNPGIFPVIGASPTVTYINGVTVNGAKCYANAAWIMAAYSNAQTTLTDPQAISKLEAAISAVFIAGAIGAS